MQILKEKFRLPKKLSELQEDRKNQLINMLIELAEEKINTSPFGDPEIIKTRWHHIDAKVALINELLES